ncbi:hypothetical protein U1Q18_016870 [Sarracenia purpurea var. burkii]
MGVEQSSFRHDHSDSILAMGLKKDHKAIVVLLYHLMVTIKVMVRVSVVESMVIVVVKVGGGGGGGGGGNDDSW